MSRSKGDQRRRPDSGKRAQCTRYGAGCPRCTTGEHKRPARRRDRRQTRQLLHTERNTA